MNLRFPRPVPNRRQVVHRWPCGGQQRGQVVPRVFHSFAHRHVDCLRRPCHRAGDEAPAEQRPSLCKGKAERGNGPKGVSLHVSRRDAARPSRQVAPVPCGAANGQQPPFRSAEDVRLDFGIAIIWPQGLTVPNEHIEDPATDLEARRAELLPIVVQQISEQDDRRRRRQTALRMAQEVVTQALGTLLGAALLYVGAVAWTPPRRRPVRSHRHCGVGVRASTKHSASCPGVAGE
jgi:hypothetical protein